MLRAIAIDATQIVTMQGAIRLVEIVFMLCLYRRLNKWEVT